jgi:hypothetical protein
LDKLKLNWFKIFALAVLQCIVGFLVSILYLSLIWIFFGEGGDSFLYTSGNKIICTILPAVGATILNGYRISQGMQKADKRKIQTYIAIQSIFFACYVLFTIIQLFQK